MMSWVAVVRAEGEVATEGQTNEVVKEKVEKPAKPPRLVKPWSGLGDLTPEQQTKIAEIRKAYNEQRKALDAKEHDEVMALLTDEQKAEIEKMTEKKTVEGKKKAEPKTEEAKKDTAPAAH
jgi:Spy/CpxP family protein refolding chaperone